MSINRALLDERLDYIADHPDEHVQSVWALRRFTDAGTLTPEWNDTFRYHGYHGWDEPACGTAFCLAGHVLNATPDVVFDWLGEGETSMAILPSGEHVSIFCGAARMLGITDAQAGLLFSGYNTLDHMRSLRDQFYAAEDAGTPWDPARCGDL